MIMTATENAFQVIRDAIFTAHITPAGTNETGVLPEQVSAQDAERYARAVLLALEHNGFEVVRHIPEPPDDD